MQSAVHDAGTVNLSADTPVFEYQETTMQVPFGVESILSELFAGRIKPIEAIVYLQLNHCSTWANGKTYWVSGRGLEKAIGVSHWYIREGVKLLGNWLTPLKTGPQGVIYQLKHHNCSSDDVPRDEYGHPLKFAVPYGRGGPIERMNAGDISWKAALIWIVLKFHSDWRRGENKGITEPMSMKMLAKLTGFGKQTVCEAIKALQQAGMLKRLSKSWQRSVFQLFPKPKPKTQTERIKAKHERSKIKVGKWQVVTTPHHVYSGNKQFRCRYLDGRWEKRVGRGNWKDVLDRDFHRIPKAIVADITPYIEARREITNRYGGSHTTQGGSQNAQGGSQGAHTDFPIPF